MAIAVDNANLGTRMPCTDNNTLTLTTTAAVASGGFIVFCAGWFLTGQTLSTVSGGGLSWSIDIQGHDSAPGNTNAAIASAQAPAGLASGTVLTATWTGAGTANSVTLGASSFTGVKTSSALDTTVGPSTSDTTAWTTGNASIAAGSLLYGFSWESNGITGSSAPTAPSLECYDVLDCSVAVHTAAYRIEASAGSYAVAGAYSSNTRSVTFGAAYLAAPTAVDTGLAWIRA